MTAESGDAGSGGRGFRGVRWRRWLLGIVAVWAVLLAASTAVRLANDAPYQPAPDQRVVEVDWAPGRAERKPVRIAYREWAGGAETGGAPPVLLLHGNPVAGAAMRPLAEALAGEFRVLVPDLPGFGRSGANVPDYSARTQAAVLRMWLDRLGVRRVHAVGYSQGSAVALALADAAPGRVTSVSLVAGVGLQAHELLGRYELNQPLYAAYYGVLWSVRWLVPHFGVLDHPALSPRTAANFADTDLRRNRGRLERLDAPTLILHSAEDRLVPYAAARAHARLVPQAGFHALPGGHLGVIRRPDPYAGALAAFFRAVAQGEAPDRAAALAGRAPPKPGLAVETGGGRLAGELLLAAALFLLVFFSEDLSCIGGGMLAATGALGLGTAIGACFAGIWVSDLLLYGLGRVLGVNAFRLRPIARLAEGRRIERFREAYAGRGMKIVFLTRFVPGSRVVAYVTAGVLRLGAVRFAGWLALAAAVWTPVLVTVAYWTGQPLMRWWERSGPVVLPVILLGVLALYGAVTLLLKAATWRGRRLLRGWWLRWRHWEFWPTWLLYAPVFVYGCRLAARYRSATVWAACNPGIEPAGGLALESKSAILACLRGAPDRVAAWTLLAADGGAEERLRALRAFQSSLETPWPVVLKPDIGQRGEGVAVVRGEAEARRYFAANGEPVIAQAYAPGEEFGVFYYRMPGERYGRVFSITEKRFPEVEGDGRRDLERLILDDPRAVALARHYLRANAGRLREVPPRGERVRLVELGTHCRGAVFLDGNRWATPELAAALDAVVADFDGFSFGRFDLRAESGEALAAGRGFRVIELNGVSSESTDIYDPGNRVWDAWRILFRQWRLAFAIGAAWRERGAPVPPAREVWRVLRGHRARRPHEALPASGDA